MIKSKQDISAVFQYFEQEQKGYVDPKYLEEDEIVLDKKTFYFGRQGNFSVKFSKIKEMAIDLDEGTMEIDTDQKRYKANGIDDMDFLMKVEKRWAKACKRRTDREQDENEADIDDDNDDNDINGGVIVRQASSRNRRRTYGGRRRALSNNRKLERFLSKNRDMLNFSEDEDAPTNRHISRQNKPKAVIENYHHSDEHEEPDTVEEEPQDEDRIASEDNDKHHDQQQQQQHEYQNSSGDDTVPMSLDETDDESVHITTKIKPKRLRRVADFTQETDDEDEAIFKDPPLTTPKAARIVSPGHTTLFTDDDDDDDDDDGKKQTKSAKSTNEKNTTPKDHKRISSFFHRKISKVQFPEIDDEDDDNGDDDDVKNEDTSKKDLSFTTDTKYNGITSFFGIKSDKHDNKSTKSASPNVKTRRTITPLRRDTTWLKKQPDDSPLKTPTHRLLSHATLGRKLNEIDDDIESVDEEENEDRPSFKRRKFPTADTVLALASLKNKPKPTNGLTIDRDTDSPRKRITFERRKNIFKGLRNHGNTCYMNSSLQLLLTLQDFISALSAVSNGRLVRSLIKVQTDLNDSSANTLTVSPRGLKRAIDALTSQFEGFEQRDAHEFVTDLIDRLHDEISTNKANQDNVILPTDDFFRMGVRQCLRCDNCGHESIKEEMYRHISVDVERLESNSTEADTRWSIRKGIHKFFQPEQRQLNCEHCGTGRTATQTLQIMSKPKALLVQVKRFVYVQARSPRPSESTVDSETTKLVTNRSTQMVVQKIKDPIMLDKTVNLSNYTKDADDGDYDIQSVIHHLGSTASSGHYTADALRKKDDGNVWVSFDDGITSTTTVDNVFQSERKQRTAYVALYRLRDE